MYSMKQVCDRLRLPYTALKYYCNEGLVPNVKRDAANRRCFDDRDVAWLEGLLCLKNTGMGIGQMKQYMELCRMGEASIPERQAMLSGQREALARRMDEIQRAIDYIDHKQDYYQDVLAGKIPYESNLKP